MLASRGSTWQWKPSMPSTRNQSATVMPSTLRVALGPPQLPLSCKAAVDPVRLAHVHGDAVELADRQVLRMLPVLPAVERQEDAAVAAGDHVVGVLRVDPQGVAVGVDRRVGLGPEGLAAVARDVQRHAEDVDAPVVVGVDADLAEVERPRAQVVDLDPRLAAVVGAEDAAGVGVVVRLRRLAPFRLALQERSCRSARRRRGCADPCGRRPGRSGRWDVPAGPCSAGPRSCRRRSSCRGRRRGRTARPGCRRRRRRAAPGRPPRTASPGRPGPSPGR